MKTCSWCNASLDGRDPRTVFCSRRCRQAAFRLRRRSSLEATEAEPGTFAYADPPYPGLAARYYGDQDTFGGEVDHADLVQQLEAGGYAGWALSTSSDALRDVLPLCPEGAHVAAWVKPLNVHGKRCGLHVCWEPLIVVGGRQRRTGVRDWLEATPARGWGDLVGRKPIAFCAWLFGVLGMQPGDTFVDLFPGTGAVARAWAELSRPGQDDEPSPKYSDDACPCPGPHA